MENLRETINIQKYKIWRQHFFGRWPMFCHSSTKAKKYVCVSGFPTLPRFSVWPTIIYHSSVILLYIFKTFWLMITIYGPRQANLVLIAYASSEGSGEPAHPRSLARTSAARSYKHWIKRNLQTENQISGPSEWLGMRSWNLSWRNARRHKFAWRGPYMGYWFSVTQRMAPWFIRAVAKLILLYVLTICEDGSAWHKDLMKCIQLWPILWSSDLSYDLTIIVWMLYLEYLFIVTQRLK